jgi:hypothetical protein
VEESDYKEEQDVGWRRRVVVGRRFLDFEGFGWEKVDPSKPANPESPASHGQQVHSVLEIPFEWETKSWRYIVQCKADLD